MLSLNKLCLFIKNKMLAKHIRIAYVIKVQQGGKNVKKNCECSRYGLRPYRLC